MDTSPARPTDAALIQRVRLALRDVPDFPRPGILFKDITPVIADGPLLRAVVERMAAEYADQRLDAVAAIESRGFIFGAAIATILGTGFVPIRKPGKLPYRTLRVDYALEYGTDAVEAHEDALAPGQRVLLVDDVLATGGTAAAARELVRRLGGHVAATAFLIELTFLGGRARLGDESVWSLVSY